MRRRRVLTLAAVTVLAVIAAVIAATRGGASESGALSRLSNEGRQVAPVEGNVWRRAGVGNVALLAIRGTRALYRLESKEGPCVGAGPANVPGKLGTVDCPRGPFPTAEQPVLDLSVYEATSHESHEVSLYRAEGVAADGVATIAFLLAERHGRSEAAGACERLRGGLDSVWARRLGRRLRRRRKGALALSLREVRLRF